MKAADRFADVQLSLIRQINALATPLSVNLGIGEPNLEPDETLRAMAARAAQQPWQYSANAGFLSLRKKIAEGTNVEPKSEICVTAGTEEALYALGGRPHWGQVNTLTGSHGRHRGDSIRKRSRRESRSGRR